MQGPYDLGCLRGKRTELHARPRAKHRDYPETRVVAGDLTPKIS